MPRAEVVEAERPGALPCPNCGDRPHEPLDVVTAGGKSAWQGCKKCWPLVLVRGQVEIVARLCRLADGVREERRQ